MRRVVNYHSSWARQQQVELFDASGNNTISINYRSPIHDNTGHPPVLIILAQFCYKIELTLRREAKLEFYTPTQALTTKRSSKLRRTLTQQLVRVENRVCSRGRAIREHTETLGSFYSLLLASKLVSAERASLKESRATKNVKNEGWKRRKSTVESYGEQ
ncbi:luc7-like protein 3 [Dorcoceras hygrometricum]|uniref:Luc7-like protein 3 n=1 Tax=Dorcoceras hygrometricum TaxID=472368 RepID=A0A2Z7DFA9_9LAMI|nr:luc7-like protein 3 [Dorcoceras hygrometricum]